MTAPSKKKDPPSSNLPDKKLDPTKATVIVAIIALVGTIAAAVIANSEKLFPKKQPPQQNSQAEVINLYQGEKYDAVMKDVDDRAKVLQQERDGLIKGKSSNHIRAAQLASNQNTKQTSADKQLAANERITKIDLYLSHNKEARRAIEEKHRELTTAVQVGDNFKAMVLKTEVNKILSDDFQEFKAVTTGVHTSTTIQVRMQPLYERIFIERKHAHRKKHLSHTKHWVVRRH